MKVAINKGVFDERWTFVGIGSLTDEYELDLGNNKTIKIYPKLSQTDYEKALAQYDLGISLMMAPHPSVLPFEMAQAGMLVVTNEYGDRKESILQEISSNILASPPSLDSLVEKLSEAVDNIDDFERRLLGAEMLTGKTWEESMPDDWVKKIIRGLDP